MMYVSSMKTDTYPLAVPSDLMGELRRCARETGLSVADTMRQSMRLGLNKLVEQLGPKQRITNIDPLPDEVLDRYYSRPERDESGIDRLIEAQALGGPD